METPSHLGQLITDGEMRRDAVHVAIAPVMATETLRPGQHVGLIGDNQHAGPSDEPVGVVDPFLQESVQKGERFLLWLYPNTVTGIRHIWTHPAFSRKRP